MNNVCIIGNITKDIELRTTNNGKSVTTVSIAFNDGYGDKQQTHFFDVMAWEKQAENLAKYCQKGSKIAIHGKLIQQNWETQQGEKRNKVLINAINITFLDSKKTQENEQVSPYDIPVAKPAEEYDPYKNMGEQISLDEYDDID